MATHEQKVKCEVRARKLLAEGGLPEPDSVEYGATCIWVFFKDAKTCLRVDIDEDPDWDDEKGEPRPGATLL